MQRTASAILIILVSILVAFGIIMLYSTSYAQYGDAKIKRQLVWVLVGAVGAIAARYVDYRNLGRRSGLLLGLVALPLLYLATARIALKLGLLSLGDTGQIVPSLPLIGGPIKGALRWLTFRGVSVQPSEFAKLVVMLYLADYYNRHARHLGAFWRGFLKPMLFAGGTIGLIFVGKDLSTTAISGAILLTMAFVAGVRLRYVLLVVLGGALFVSAALTLSPMRRQRMATYRNPEQHQMAAGYQLWSSQLALGSGGPSGLGFTKSRMKQRYLPEAHTDFIVAIVGEELGFMGVGMLVLAYLCTMGTAFWIGAHAVDRTGCLLATGVGASLGLHALVNVGVVSGFLPTTGVTAPFLSYGGSSMIASLVGIGILLSVSRIAEHEALGRRLQEPVVARRVPAYRMKFLSNPKQQQAQPT